MRKEIDETSKSMEVIKIILKYIFFAFWYPIHSLLYLIFFTLPKLLLRHGKNIIAGSRKK